MRVAWLAGFERKLVQGGGQVIERMFFMGVGGLSVVWRQDRHGLP